MSDPRQAQSSWWHGSPSITFALYLVLAIVMLGANPFKQQTVGPFDLLATQGAWRAVTHETKLRHSERSDILDALLPRWMNAREQLRQGNLPVWDPLPKGGSAGIQHLPNSELTPAFLLFVAAATPALGFYLATLFNLVAAGFGAYLWLARRTAAPAAVFGGVTIMLCGFHAAWLFWPHTMTSIWICWALWATDRWWARPSALNFGLLTAALSLLILGGFPFVTLLGLGAVALYLLVLALSGEARGRKVSAALGAAASLALAMGLCAIPLTFFLTWLRSMDMGYRLGWAGSGLQLLADADQLLPSVAKTTPGVETTMYVGALPLALAPVAIVLLLAKRPNAVMGWFAAGLTAVGAVLVFELIPARYLAWVPGLSNNSWSRAIILLDIGLAALSTWLLDRMIGRCGLRLVVLGAVATVTLYQAYDLGTLFRRFNGPVPSAYVYPKTPLISRVQATIGPFQSVIVDDNFLVSGVLGAYGLREWLAHAFMDPRLSPTLTQLADAPFTTPTATRISAGSYHLDSPAMRVLAVRYALGGPQLVFARITPEVKPIGHASANPLPPLPAHDWIQTLAITRQACIHAIGIRLATYTRTGLAGSVQMQLRGSDGRLIATQQVPAAQVADNAMQSFPISGGVCLPAGSYTLAFAYQSPGPADELTAWSFPGEGTNCSLMVDGYPYPACADIELLAEKTRPPPFDVVAEDHGIYLLENRLAPAGPYFLKQLSDTPSAESARSVQTSMERASHFTLSYQGMEPGYVVVPMCWASGWHALVDGEPVTPSLYYGCLPALPVSGPAHLDLAYRPDSFRIGLWLSALAATLLAACLLLLHRYSPRAAQGIGA